MGTASSEWSVPPAAELGCAAVEVGGSNDDWSVAGRSVAELEGATVDMGTASSEWSVPPATEHGGETVEDGELMQDLDGSPDIHRESSFKIALSLTRAKGHPL